MTAYRDKFVEVDALDPAAPYVFNGLLKREVFAIRVKNVFSRKACAKYAAIVLKDIKLEGYDVAPRFQHHAPALFDLDRHPDQLGDYLDMDSTRRIRKAMAETWGPSYRIRSLTDEWSPSGAMLARFFEHGPPSPTGMLRALLPAAGSMVLPHVDDSKYDLRNLVPDADIAQNFSWVVPLACDRSEGHLRLWDCRPTQEELTGLGLPSSAYGLDETKLPPVFLTVPPEVGSATIFDARCVHAVGEVTRSPRITESGMFATGLLDTCLMHYR